MKSPRLYTYAERKAKASEYWADFMSGMKGFINSKKAYFILAGLFLLFLVFAVGTAFQAESFAQWWFILAGDVLRFMALGIIIFVGFPIALALWFSFKIFLMGRDVSRDFAADGAAVFMIWIVIGWALYALAGEVPVWGYYITRSLEN